MSKLPKIKSAKVYESLLWLSFLVATFFIGFFHGSSPEKQINFYYQDLKRVDILVQQDGVLTPALVKYLEKETHSQINTVVKKTYKDFRTELIVNKNLILVLTPEAFIEPLYNDNRIKNIESLSSLISTSVHPDFQPIKYENQAYYLPLSWFVNVFSPPKKTDKATYINYAFLLNQKKKNHYFPFAKNYELVNQWAHELKPNEVFETTLQLASLQNKNYVIDSQSSFLITFALAIPNNTPDRRLSLELLRLILANKEIKTLLAENGLGQTFLDPRINYSVSHFVAPESIRNLNLKNFNNGNKVFEENTWNRHSLIEH